MPKNKKTETGPTTDELIAKYSTKDDGGFPFPEIPENASDELYAEILRVRGAVRRKAQGSLVDFVVDHKGDLEEMLTEYQLKAIAHLTAERSRGRKGAGGTNGVPRGRVTVEEKVYAFFADEANHLAADGVSKTPGKVAAVNVFIQLEMDPMRVLGAAKRILDTREADERLWISYKSAERCYVVEGPQVDAPKSWTGPLPVPKSADDLNGV
jgi:hypothetical protein